MLHLVLESAILKSGALQRLVQLNGSVFAQPLPGLAKDHPMPVVSKVTLRIVQCNPRPIARMVLLQPLQDLPFGSSSFRVEFDSENPS